MKFSPGKETQGPNAGRVVLREEDGMPYWFTDETETYAVCRAMTPSGWRYDAWLRRYNTLKSGARGQKWEVPEPILLGCSTAKEAREACEAHYGINHQVDSRTAGPIPPVGAGAAAGGQLGLGGI